MANRVSNFANAFRTTLSAGISSTDTTFPVVTTSGGPTSPAYIVIDPSVDAKREIIFADGTFDGTNFRTTTTANRHLTGSAAASGLTHDSGAEVVVVPVAQWFEDLHDRVTQHAHGGSTDGAAVSANVDHGAMIGLADDDHTQYLNNTRHDVTSRHPTTVLGDGSGLGLRQIVVFTASGTFTKADYPWLRAVKVICIGGGGGAGGCNVTGAGEMSAAGGGGGGALAMSYIEASALAASETVTVGAGGAGATTYAGGSDGGDSSFGSHVVADNGYGGQLGTDGGVFPRFGANGGNGGNAALCTGQVTFSGCGGVSPTLLSSGSTLRGIGGASPMQAGARFTGFSTGSANPATIVDYGAGGYAGINPENTGTVKAGNDGVDGVVIVELYA